MYLYQIDHIVYGRKTGLSLAAAVDAVRGCGNARVLRADGTVVLTSAGSTELPWIHAPSGRKIHHRMTQWARRRWEADMARRR